jgi:hypothetical protein
MEASPTKRGYIRLAAMHSLLMGVPRETVCQILFRSDRMVRLWIERFNAGGIDGLITRNPPRRAELNTVREVARTGVAGSCQSRPDALDGGQTPRLSKREVGVSGHHLRLLTLQLV